MSTTKKTKGQKMDLSVFIGSDNSWADYPTQQVSSSQPILPEQPAALQTENQRANYSSQGSSQGTEPDYSKIKPGGPYVAYVGNFPYETTEADLATFFQGLNVASIRILTDHQTGQSRGHGYVDFHDEQSLRHALSVNGTAFGDRKLKIDVAESKTRGQDSRRTNSGSSMSQGFGGFRNSSDVIGGPQSRPSSRYGPESRSQDSGFRRSDNQFLRQTDMGRPEDTPSDWRGGPKTIVGVVAGNSKVVDNPARGSSMRRADDGGSAVSSNGSAAQGRRFAGQGKPLPQKYSDSDFVFRRKE